MKRRLGKEDGERSRGGGGVSKGGGELSQLTLLRDGEGGGGLKVLISRRPRFTEHVTFGSAASVAQHALVVV